MTLRPDRRAFIGGSLSLGGLALFGCKTSSAQQAGVKEAGAGPTKLYVRKALTSPAAANDIALYKKAVAILKANKVWLAQANIHNNFCTHGNWFFLPWHRFYLMYFEEICRNALRSAGESDDFAIPYWSWPDTGRKIPDIAWGDGNPLFDDTRDMGPNDTFPDASCGAGTVSNIMLIKNYMDFGGGRTNVQRGSAGAGQLEGTPHNTVHSYSGGDMSTFMSPLDPIFWMHHANVDRLWAQWQAAHPGIIPTNPNAKDAHGKSASGVVLDSNFWLNFVLDGYEDLKGVRFTQVVKNCLDHTKMIKPYTYDVLKGAAGLNLDDAAAVAAPSDRIFVQSQNDGLIVKVDQAAKIISANITFSEDIKPYIAQLSSQSNFTGSLSLIVENIPVPTDDLAHRLALNFYVNHPDLTTETDASDPHFLNAYTFFIHNHPGSPTTVSLRISLNQPFLKMREAGFEIRDSMLLQVLVKDRLLQTLPSLTFLSPVTFRLIYTDV